MTTPTTTDEQLRIRVAELCGWTKPYPALQNCWQAPSDYSGPLHGSDGGVLPNYPADLNAAFTLVDALAGEGWKTAIYDTRQRIIDETTNVWVVVFYLDGKEHTATNPSLAVAVCMAFVKVKEQS